MKRGRRLAATKLGRVVKRWPSMCRVSRQWRMYDFVMRGEFERWLTAQANITQPATIVRTTGDTRPLSGRWDGYDTGSSLEQYGTTSNPVRIGDIVTRYDGTTWRI